MKYFFGFLASVGLIIFVLILVLKGFSGGPTTKGNALAADYANSDAQVVMTVDGRIISNQEHSAYRITVGRSEARIETLKGYDGDVVDTKTYTNTQESYTNFLRALDVAGYTKGVTNATTAAKDERGVCAIGKRFVFEIVNGPSDVQRYWSTSCGHQGTFKGNATTAKQLFNHQIPTKDFNSLIARLQL